MHKIFTKITRLIEEKKDTPDFLDVLFKDHKQEILDGAPLVLFGAGQFGGELCYALKRNGIKPVAFCDNSSKDDRTFYELPVISFETLKTLHKNSFILISTQKGNNEISQQLLSAGFSASSIFGRKDELGDTLEFIYMYCVAGTQDLFCHIAKVNKDPFNFLLANEEKIVKLYNLLADEKSKKLFLTKLALLVSKENFELCKHFLLEFSEPVHVNGIKYTGNTEDNYYFNNDVISLSQDEVYVDVGAYDGDTPLTFSDACSSQGINYKHIYAFEPDTKCFTLLKRNVAKLKNISCSDLGIWSETKTIGFSSSDKVVSMGKNDQSGAINNSGDMEIETVTLDDYFSDAAEHYPPTFIKMDPAGNVIIEALKGAKKVIAQYKPKLALGAYHSLEAIWKIPLLVHEICPEYKLYLRHGTCHLCDTDLFAFV